MMRSAGLISRTSRKPAHFIPLLLLFVVISFGSLPGCASAQTVSLYTVVDLALRNSAEIHMAQADVRRAAAGSTEAHDAYLPNFLLGSNIGYSYGFPVGQPTIVNVQSNSLVFSFSQPDYVRSARAAEQAANLALKNIREKVALDASLDYVELSTDQQELAALKDEMNFGERLIEIESERVAAGLDSRVDETRARLTNAQLDLRRIQLLGHSDVLAEKLANLTGLPLIQITADPASIPAAPSIARATGEVHQSNGVQAAYASAKSKLFVAFGDDRVVDRPTFGLGLTYNRFAEFNNYQDYYTRFQHNNFGIGVNISIPVFDESRRAHARVSAAEAAHAMSEADQLRNTETEQKLELSRNIQTLVAQQRVAELQQQLAQDQLDAVEIELRDGTGRAGAAPVTPREEQQARIDERRYTVDLLDARFQLMQAELSELRADDELETWAMQLPKP